MDEQATIEFVMTAVSKFEIPQATFKSVTRNQRDQTMLFRGVQLFSENQSIPPVGAYEPKHIVIDKGQTFAHI